MKKYSVVSDLQEITVQAKSLCSHSAPKIDIPGRMISLPSVQDRHSVVIQQKEIQHVGGWARSRNAIFCTEPV